MPRTDTSVMPGDIVGSDTLLAYWDVLTAEVPDSIGVVPLDTALAYRDVLVAEVPDNVGVAWLDSCHDGVPRTTAAHCDGWGPVDASQAGEKHGTAGVALASAPVAHVAPAIPALPFALAADGAAGTSGAALGSSDGFRPEFSRAYLAEDPLLAEPGFRREETPAYLIGEAGERGSDAADGSGNSDVSTAVPADSGAWNWLPRARPTAGMDLDSQAAPAGAAPAATLPTYTIDQVGDYIKQGWWDWFDGGKRYRSFNVDDFAGAGYNDRTLYYNYTGFSGLVGAGTDTDGITAARQALVDAALDYIGEALGITFVQTADQLDYVDIYFKDNSVKGGAFSNSQLLALGNGTANHRYIDYSWVNMDPSWAGGASGINDYSYQSFIHEIGHALGLGHGGPYNTTSHYVTATTDYWYGNNSNIYLNDSWQMAVMSYIDQDTNTWLPPATDRNFVISYMGGDWEALRDYYGSSSAFNGNTVYGFTTNIPASVSKVWADLFLYADQTAFCLIDSDGTDTVDFSGYAADQRIDISEVSGGSTVGTVSDIGGQIGNMTIAVGTIIENVYGGSGNDTISGNTVYNELYGGGGDDEMRGSDWAYQAVDGGDYMHGGDGNDFMGGHAGDDQMYGDAGNDSVIGDAGNDILNGGSAADWVVGDYTDDTGNGNDTLYGEYGSDTLEGGPGNDYLSSGADDDRLEGGNGRDTLYGSSGLDTLDGSAGDDYLSGGDGEDRLEGGAGNDTIRGWDGDDRVVFAPGFGSDSVDGGAGGSDWVDFSQLPYWVTTLGIDIGVGFTDPAGGSILTIFTNIENADGSQCDDLITGTAVANTINGNGGDDTVYAGGGDDDLSGGDGGDSLAGEAGSDTLYGGNGDDAVVGGASGDACCGGDGNDSINGSADADTTDAGSGNDRIYDGDFLNFEHHDGGLGTDWIDYSSIAFGSAVEINLATGETRVLIPGANADTILNFENASGSQGAERIIGSGVSNQLDGNAGADTIDAGQGADTVYARSGDDRVVDGDAVNFDILDGGYGSDWVDYSTITFGSPVEINLATGQTRVLIFGANTETILHFENVDGSQGGETIVGSVVGNQLNGNGGSDSVAGGSGNDTLQGGDGNDTLVGGTGIDALRGGLGDDRYLVDDPTDVVTELALQGVDLVQTSLNYTLPGNVENLALTRSAAVDGAGNSLANALTGNIAANTLTGLAGSDLLDGRGGADTLKGGTGDDTYIRDNIGDVITELTRQGIDLVKTNLSYTLGANVENLTLTGTTAVNGTGNGLANTLIGNSGSNVLNGLGGNDNLNGAGGNDSLSGGADSDVFRFDTPLDAHGNVDTISDFEVGTDEIQLENSVFTLLTPRTSVTSADFAKVSFWDGGGNATVGSDVNIIYDQDSGKLYYDTDGGGEANRTLFATLSGSPDFVTSADFAVT